MRRSAHAAVLGPLVVLGLALLSFTPARADDFSLFRIPDHRVSSWDGSLNGMYGRDAFNMAEEQSKTHRFFGSASTGAFWYSETDSRFTSVNLLLQAQGRASTADRLHQYSPAPGQLQAVLDEISQRDANETWFIDVGTRLYLWEPPIGIALRASGSGTYSQSWATGDNQQVDNIPPFVQNVVQQGTRNDYGQAHRAAGDVTLGLGKVRDATGVYEAMVMERRLMDRGVIRGRLRTSTRQRIAELLYVRYDVQATVSRPARRLWEEVERALREDNAVDIDRLDAESIMRAGEGLFGVGITNDVLPRSPLLRRRGMFVGGMARAAHFKGMSWGEMSTYSRYTLDDSVVSEFTNADSFSVSSHDDALWAGPSGEWHWPFGPRVQLDAQATLLYALSGEDGRWNESSSLDLGWIIADRWLASAGARHSRWIGPQFVGSDISGEGWSVSYGGTVRYYLEDRVAIELSGQEIQDRADYFHPLADLPTRYIRSASVRLGLSFHFMGQFDAPGLMRPIRI